MPTAAGHPKAIHEKGSIARAREGINSKGNKVAIRYHIERILLNIIGNTIHVICWTWYFMGFWYAGLKSAHLVAGRPNSSNEK